MSQHDGTHQPMELKKITTRQLLDNLSNFAQEFEELDPQVVISTPQADHGIGPVEYYLKLHTNCPAPVGALRALNRLVKLEQFRGDQLIKLDASLLFLATGKEDPYGFLPPGCRAAIRTEIQQ
jgi:hypothetical protein